MEGWTRGWARAFLRTAPGPQGRAAAPAIGPPGFLLQQHLPQAAWYLWASGGSPASILPSPAPCTHSAGAAPRPLTPSPGDSPPPLSPQVTAPLPHLPCPGAAPAAGAPTGFLWSTLQSQRNFQHSPQVSPGEQYQTVPGPHLNRSQPWKRSDMAQASEAGSVTGMCAHPAGSPRVQITTASQT